MKHLISYCERDKKDYDFICLENLEDVSIWRDINSKIRSKQAVNFWINFKSSTFYDNPLLFAQHSNGQENTLGWVLGLKMVNREKTSMLQYCSDSDDIIISMNNSALKFVMNGKFVRINKHGGMCPVDDLSEYKSIRDINEVQMLHFMTNQPIDTGIKIDKQYVILENGSSAKYLCEKFCKKYNVDIENVQIINSFKDNTVLYKPTDFFILFNDGVNAGLENIIFDTTAGDKSQINGIKQIIENVMHRNPDKNINIYAKMYDKDKALLKTQEQNINIHFMER